MDAAPFLGSGEMRHRVTFRHTLARLPVTRTTVARYVSCYFIRSMKPSRGGTADAAEPAGEILFACAHCAAQFLVDAAAAGATLNCESCGKPTRVPSISAEPATPEALRLADLNHQLKENQSQRTEIAGYINQLSIQLHRWELRLQTLNQRQAKLEAEIAAVSGK